MKKTAVIILLSAFTLLIAAAEQKADATGLPALTIKSNPFDKIDKKKADEEAKKDKETDQKKKDKCDENLKRLEKQRDSEFEKLCKERDNKLEKLREKVSKIQDKNPKADCAKEEAEITRLEIESTIINETYKGKTYEEAMKQVESDMADAKDAAGKGKKALLDDFKKDDAVKEEKKEEKKEEAK